MNPFEVQITNAEIDDLRRRLEQTRWPESETVDDWSQGIPLAYTRELCEYWRTSYDMQRLADRLNRHPQFTTEIDGVEIHFLHVRSGHSKAMPLILTHGWPGSVVEFLDVIEPLSQDFHLVIPSLPGYGWSGRPRRTGWGVAKIAEAWAKLMARLGYEHYMAQGGDWGSSVTTHLGRLDREHAIGIHLNMGLLLPDALLKLGDPTADEQAALANLANYRRHESGYAMQQRTKPQTLGYGLTDSPAGQCAWIVEKFKVWADGAQTPESAFARDDLLDNVMVYWLTKSATSSARLYWESMNRSAAQFDATGVRVAYTAFPAEIARMSERWARALYPGLVYYSRAERGGHFAAMEVPDLFVEEVRHGLSAIASRTEPAAPA
jgi:pimeloyl-ACP methyl ester carboxylesterase